MCSLWPNSARVMSWQRWPWSCARGARLQSCDGSASRDPPARQSPQWKTPLKVAFAAPSRRSRPAQIVRARPVGGREQRRLARLNSNLVLGSSTGRAPREQAAGPRVNNLDEQQSGLLQATARVVHRIQCSTPYKSMTYCWPSRPVVGWSTNDQQTLGCA